MSMISEVMFKIETGHSYFLSTEEWAKGGCPINTGMNQLQLYGLILENIRKPCLQNQIGSDATYIPLENMRSSAIVYGHTVCSK